MLKTLNPRYFERTFIDDPGVEEDTIINRAKNHWEQYVNRMLEDKEWKKWWDSHDWLDVGDGEHSFDDETSVRDELKEAFLMGYLVCFSQKLTGEQQ